jgi:hypothetical protein
MNPLEYFQQIYIINLPQRRDRRREMAQQLKAVGMSFRDPCVRLFEAVRPDDSGPFPSIGARGAFLSHLGVLKDARDKNLSRILIFEDDLNFVPGFSSKIAAVVAALEREDWSFFYGGYVLTTQVELQNGNLLVPAESSLPIQTAHFIALQGNAIEETIEYLEALLTRSGGDPRGGPMHVDGAYSHLRHASPNMLTLLATPQLGYQRSSRSDIYDLRWFDRLPGVRQAVEALRGIKNRVR